MGAAILPPGVRCGKGPRHTRRRALQRFAMRDASASDSLCHALLTLGPPNSASPRVLEQAAATLFQAATAIARRFLVEFRRLRVDAEQIASDAVMKLRRRGPLRGDPTAPADDEAARRYLRTVVKRLLIDAERKRKRDGNERAEAIGHDEEGRRPIDPADQGPNAEARLAAVEQERVERAQIAQAEERLAAIRAALVAQRNAARRGTGDGLVAQLDLLARAARGEVDVGALTVDDMRARGEDPDDPVAYKRTRNKIDQGFVRARRALFAAVQAAIDAGDPAPGTVGAQLVHHCLETQTQVRGEATPRPASEANDGERRSGRSRPGHSRTGG